MKDGFLEQIADGCTRLTMTDLESCGTVADVGLTTRATHWVDLAESNWVPENHRLRLDDCHQSLFGFDLAECSGCKNVTDSDMTTVSKHYPRCLTTVP